MKPEMPVCAFPVQASFIASLARFIRIPSPSNSFNLLNFNQVVGIIVRGLQPCAPSCHNWLRRAADVFKLCLSRLVLDGGRFNTGNKVVDISESTTHFFRTIVQHVRKTCNMKQARAEYL